jgi:hypothetical protein
MKSELVPSIRCSDINFVWCLECDCRWGLGQLIITTSNYNAFSNFHTLQITRAHDKPSQSAFTSCFLVMDINIGDSLASVLTSLLAGKYPTTELLLQTFLVITSRHGLLRKVIRHCCNSKLLVKNLLPHSELCYVVYFVAVT